MSLSGSKHGIDSPSSVGQSGLAASLHSDEMASSATDRSAVIGTILSDERISIRNGV